MERVIKRYRNRKLYDTSESRYIRSSDIIALIRAEIPFRIVSNDSGEDVTRMILMQLIIETQPADSVPVDDLKSAISDGSNLFRRAFEKTVQIGKGVAGRIERDFETIRSKIGGQSDDRKKLDWDIVRGLISNAGRAVNFVINEKLRKQMLHLPNLSDVERIREKLDRIEAIVDVEGTNHGG